MQFFYKVLCFSVTPMQRLWVGITKVEIFLLRKSLKTGLFKKYTSKLVSDSNQKFQNLLVLTKLPKNIPYRGVNFVPTSGPKNKRERGPPKSKTIPSSYFLKLTSSDKVQVVLFWAHKPEKRSIVGHKIPKQIPNERERVLLNDD